MTPKELADALNGIEYSATMRLHGSDLIKLAKNAGPTWRLIGEMVAAGITKLRIGKELHGAKARGLQLSKNLVTVRNAERVKRLHAELMESDALVDGARTAKLIADMLEDQLGNRRRVAESIGCTQADLQGKFKRVRKAFALAVEDAHRRMSE